MRCENFAVNQIKYILGHHLESLESTQEARVSLGYRLEQLLHFRALQPSHMHPQLHIRNKHANIFFYFN